MMDQDEGLCYSLWMPVQHWSAFQLLEWNIADPSHSGPELHHTFANKDLSLSGADNITSWVTVRTVAILWSPSFWLLNVRHTHTRTVRGISALSQGTLLHWIGVVGSNKIHLLKYSTGILCYLSVTYSKYSVLYYIILLLHCKLRDIYLMMLATLQIQINNTKYIFRM